MSDDLIRNVGPKVLAQMVITLYAGPEDKPGPLNVAFPQDEIITRYMLDKARDTMADHWRLANAPRVLPGNGVGSLPDSLRKHLRG